MTTAARPINPPGRKIPHYIGAMAAAYAFIGGLISLTGWLTGVQRLTDWWSTGVSIKANTAIAIMAAAIGLLTLVYPFKTAGRVGQGLGLFTLLIGGVSFIEHITNFSFGIDTLLVDEPAGAPATSAPGRMGPPAALCLVVLGIALFLRASGTRKTLGVALSLAAVGISMLSLVGYLYDAKVMYMLPRVSGIAAQTATMLLALGVGIISAHPDQEPMKTLCEDSGIGILARRVMTAAVVVPIFLGWLRIQGARAGIYDNAFGTALRSIIEIVILVSVLGWSIQAIRLRELRQRHAEAERQITEQRLVHMLESMTDGFVTLDESWHFNYVNGEAARIFSRDPNELIGAVLWEEFPEIINTPLHAELHRAALARISIEVESPDFVASGNRHFRHRIYPAIEGGLSLYMQDVTARKQAEDALREINRRKDEFLATLAHELRNPLAPIRSAAAILMEHNVPPPTIQSSAAIIDRQVRHMGRLLEDLLDIARISRSRLELRKAHIDLTRVVQNALESIRPVTEASGHEFRVALPSEPIMVDADAVRLAQVISNVLNNATKYTPPGGCISVTMEADINTTTIHITDSGIGIDSESLPHIFEMFTQVAPTSPGGKSGLGIGLALAREIVELHGGTIEAFSAGTNTGSKFSVHMPRLQGNVLAPADTSEKSITIDKKRLLIVDDLKDNADALATLLKHFGHEVQVAYGGHAALIAAEAFRPEALLTDIGMPELDGLEVCKKIRLEPWGQDMFIVALTGWGQADDLLRTREAGFNAHMIKPVNLSELLKLMATIPPSNFRS